MILKDLKENQVEFYYQTMSDDEDEVYDEDGYLTGETSYTYSNPVHAWARISPNTTEVEQTPFGKDLVYDKMISTVQDLPITETSQLFVDILPELNEDGSTDTKPDYEVVKVAKDMHQKMWAIRRIEGRDGNKSKPAQSF